MKSMRVMISVLVVSAAAALLGAACTSSDKPANRDATDVGAPVGSDRAAPTRGEYVFAQHWGGGGRGCALLQDGAYCGGHSGVRGDPKTLYRCFRGVRSVIEVCPKECVWEEAGTPDYCL